VLCNTYAGVVSRGLGQRQLTILTILARYKTSAPRELLGLRVEEIAQDVIRLLGLTQERASALSSTRRALAKMRSASLVSSRYYPRHQGQPRVWRITSVGLAELRRRTSSDDCAVDMPDD